MKVEEFLTRIQSPLLPRVSVTDAAHLFDVNVGNTETDDDIMARINDNVDKAVALARYKVHDIDVMSQERLPEITILTYPAYYVCRIDDTKSIIYDVRQLEKWFEKPQHRDQLIKPDLARPFSEEDARHIMRRICALRLTYASVLLEDVEDVSALVTLWQNIDSIEQVSDYRRILLAIKNASRNTPSFEGSNDSRTKRYIQLTILSCFIMSAFVGWSCKNALQLWHQSLMRRSDEFKNRGVDLVKDLRRVLREPIYEFDMQSLSESYKIGEKVRELFRQTIEPTTEIRELLVANTILLLLIICMLMYTVQRL